MLQGNISTVVCSAQIADQFAFIPREAISRFLTFCSECQRKQPGGGARRLGPTHHRLDTEQQLDADRGQIQTLDISRYLYTLDIYTY